MAEKYTKAGAHYGHSESCGNCASMNRDGSCKKVQGQVSPVMVCDLWTAER